MRERDDWRRRIEAESSSGGGGDGETGTDGHVGGGDRSAGGVHRGADGLALDPAMERLAERVAAPLRTPERAEATFKSRLMASVRAEANLARAATAIAAPNLAAAAAPPPRVVTTGEPWYRRDRRVTPLMGLAAAAAIAAVAFLGGREIGRAGAGTGAAAATAAASSPTSSTDTVRVVQFVFVAPGARRVALVGDFNGWDREATRLQPGGARGLWTVAVALPAGRHEYAFVVDGTRWEADPAAAASSVTDDFGVVTSVVSVDGPPRRSTS